MISLTFNPRDPREWADVQLIQQALGMIDPKNQAAPWVNIDPAHPTQLDSTPIPEFDLSDLDIGDI